MEARTEQLVKALRGVKPNKWWLHESALSHKLGIRPKEGLSVHDQFSLFLKCLKNRYVGRKDHPSYKALSCGKVDLSKDAANEFKMHSRSYGGKEDFAASALASVSAQCFSPRYYSVGGGTVDITRQVEMV